MATQTLDPMTGSNGLSGGMNNDRQYRRGRSTLNLDDIPEDYMRKDVPLPQIGRYSDKNIALLFKVFQNSLRMMMDRGYPGAEQDYNHYKNLSVEDFFNQVSQMIDPRDPNKSSFFRCLCRIYRTNQYTTDYPEDTESIRTTVVYFQETYGNTKLSLAAVRPFFKYILDIMRESTGLLRVIFIHHGHLENETIRQFGEINRSRQSIDITRLGYVDLCHVVVDNLSVPLHLLIDREEADDLLRCVKSTDIPPICWNDPVRMYYGFPLGSIIRVNRINSVYSSTASQTDYYRIVISGLLDDQLTDEQYTIREIFRGHSKPVVVKATMVRHDGDDITLEEEAAIEYEHLVQTVDNTIAPTGEGDIFGGIDQIGETTEG